MGGFFPPRGFFIEPKNHWSPARLRVLFGACDINTAGLEFKICLLVHCLPYSKIVQWCRKKMLMPFLHPAIFADWTKKGDRVGTVHVHFFTSWERRLIIWKSQRKEPKNHTRRPISFWKLEISLKRKNLLIRDLIRKESPSQSPITIGVDVKPIAKPSKPSSPASWTNSFGHFSARTCLQPIPTFRYVLFRRVELWPDEYLNLRTARWLVLFASWHL